MARPHTELAQRSVAMIASITLVITALTTLGNATKVTEDEVAWPVSALATARTDAAGQPVTWSAAAAIDDAVVTLPSAPDGRCRPEPLEHRHICSPQPWLWVGRHGAMVAGAATAGLWVHPAPRGERTSIRWDNLQLGATLRGRLGLERGAGSGGPMVLTIRVADRDVGTFEVSDDLSARTFELPIPPGAARGSLELVVFAHQDGRRMAVLDLVMLGSRAAIDPVAVAAEATPTATEARP